MSPSRPFARHFAELVHELALEQPDRPALVGGGRTLSYAGLHAETGAAADALNSLGVRRGGTVGLLCTNRIEWVTTALGAMRIGARVAAFNTFAKAWDLDYMLAHSGAEVLVTLDGFRSSDYLATLAELIPAAATDAEWASDRFPRLRHVVVIGDARLPGTRSLVEVTTAAAPRELAEPVSAVDDAYVLYTSGSSARPKAVPVQHYAAIENGWAIGERMRVTPVDRVWTAVPLFWAYGALNAMAVTLTRGAAAVLQPAFDADGALDLIESHECTVAYTLPNMTDAMVSSSAFGPERTRSLRTGLTLGNEADLRKAAGVLGVAEICNIYGGTETYGNCCVTPAEWPLERKLDCQGPPLPGVELRVVDPEAGTELPPGEVGELHVRGYLARGYLGDDTGAGSAFGDDGWFRTGDLAALDQDGCLHFAARATEMIKTGGINVAPREVEEFLALHPDVDTAAVVGARDESLGEVVVAFVVAGGDALTESSLLAWCGERIARYKVPARIHMVRELPKTDTGKLARRALVDLDRDTTARVA